MIETTFVIVVQTDDPDAILRVEQDLNDICESNTTEKTTVYIDDVEEKEQ